MENTHNTCYGSPIDSDYFTKVKDAIELFNIKLHIDGARIFNASIALNQSVSTLAKNADSITCCLSKGLSCPSGSLIMGNKKFIAKARRLRKVAGGGMRQAGILAAAGIYALDNMVERLSEDHKNAKILGEELENINYLKLDKEKITTNLIFFYLEKETITDNQFISELLKHDVKIDTKGNRKFRIATHYGFTNNDIEKVIKTIKLILDK